jgi:hypothetical protein
MSRFQGSFPRSLGRCLPALLLAASCSIAPAQVPPSPPGSSVAHALSRSANPDSVGVASAGSLWPGGVVYYDDGGCIAGNSCPGLAQAISTSNADFPGVLQWTKRTTQPTYVVITLSGTGGRGDVNTIGYPATSGPVAMNCNTDCNIATLLHEMGHIIGLYHEQTRTDRDSHVAMAFQNVIKSTWVSNFAINTQNQQLLSSYDYASVMQYPSFVDSANGAPVIETIPAGIPLQGTEGVPGAGNQDYSAGDKESILRLYGHAPTAITVTSNPVGLQIVVDGVTYTTPHTFNWPLLSTHDLSVASGVQTLTGDIENSTQSATFYYTYGTWSDSTAQSHQITVTPGPGGPAFPTNSPAVATYTANFVQLVPYTVSAFPSGSGTVAPSPAPQTYSGAGGSFYVARQVVSLSATPGSGYNFYEFNAQSPYFWLPGGLSANPKQFFVPDTGNPVAINAEFTTYPVYTVTLFPSAPVADLFSSNFWAYVDGNFWYTPKNFSPDPSYDGAAWNFGTTHTLSLSYNGDLTNPPEYPYSANSRFEFSSWSDGGAYSHTTAPLPPASTTYQATVNPAYAPATNFGFPPCGGTATITPASTDGGYYPPLTQLTYSATPANGWTFAGWTYDLSGTTTPVNFGSGSETLVYANFNTTNTPLAVTSLSPASVSAGSPSFTLTINGTGFTPASLVSVNGTYVSPVTYHSSTQLQVTVNSSLVASNGNFDVYVENYPNGWNGCAVFGYDTFAVTAALPSVTVTPSASTITTNQPLSVNVTVSGNSTPTGSVVLSSGSYSSAATTLVAGSATINVPAGQLAVGPDILTATYTPDAASASAYSTAAGTAPVTVNQGIGTCSTANPNPNPNPASFANPADFNGDCKSDILWRNSTSQQVYTWLMNGVSIASQGPASSPASVWGIQGVGDFNADGMSDILWRNSTTGEVYLWLMNGSSIATQASLGVIPSDWVIQGLGDFNGDGKADILWRNSTSGLVYLWLMNGTSIASQGSVSSATNDWVIQDAGDFNGDGKADILWRNSTSGMVYVWLMNGTTIVSQGSPATASSDWVIQGVGDFNGDGKSDILWRNSNSNLVYVWLMNGAAIGGQSGVSSPSSDWVIKGVGDYNGDGKSDILWRNSTSGQVYFWLMNGTTINSQGSPGTVSSDWQIAPILAP